jgi:ABC-type sugar transport system ATPase subunit
MAGSLAGLAREPVLEGEGKVPVAEPWLRVQGVSKRFPGAQALSHVDLDVLVGEVHALVGENGAGKTTLMNILGGVFPSDEGLIELAGSKVQILDPSHSQRLGIATIHQELALMPNLTVMENLYMWDMPTGLFGRVRYRELERRSLAVLRQLGVHMNPRKSVGELSTGMQQLVEIAKALTVNCRLLIMDEPNSSLTQTESEVLFGIIDRLKNAGVAILYVSHRIDEVLRISDRISVLRDGRLIGTLERSEATAERVVQMMVGRALAPREAVRATRGAKAVLEVRRLRSKARIKDVSFTLHQGEILGLAGLVGAGRTEVAQAIFGIDRLDAGQILLDGVPVKINGPYQAIKRGIGMVPEDRKEMGLFLEMALKTNITVAGLDRWSRAGFVRAREELRVATEGVRSLAIHASSLDQIVNSLSGGNQQKAVLARWLALKPRILILDEPTHGIDVGSKAEIYQIMAKLVESGVSILLISSELPEILRLSDRIIVMHEGRVRATLDRDEATQERIMAYATALE